MCKFCVLVLCTRYYTKQKLLGIHTYSDHYDIKIYVFWKLQTSHTQTIFLSIYLLCLLLFQALVTENQKIVIDPGRVRSHHILMGTDFKIAINCIY